MEKSKGNILNRPVRIIRDKNHTYNQNEESKNVQAEQFKVQKMKQISAYRTKAIMGNKQERLQVTKMYQNECSFLDNAKKEKV